MENTCRGGQESIVFRESWNWGLAGHLDWLATWRPPARTHILSSFLYLSVCLLLFITTMSLPPNVAVKEMANVEIEESGVTFVGIPLIINSLNPVSNCNSFTFLVFRFKHVVADGITIICCMCNCGENGCFYNVFFWLYWKQCWSFCLCTTLIHTVWLL